MSKFKKESGAKKKTQQSPLENPRSTLKYKNFATGKTTDPSDHAQHTSFTSTTRSAKAKPNLPSKLTFLTNRGMELYMG